MGAAVTAVTHGQVPSNDRMRQRTNPRPLFIALIDIELASALPANDLRAGGLREKAKWVSDSLLFGLRMTSRQQHCLVAILVMRALLLSSLFTFTFFFVEQAARWCGGRSRFAPGRSVNLFRHTNYRLPIAVPAIRRKFVYDLTRRRIDAKHVALANY